MFLLQLLVQRRPVVSQDTRATHCTSYVQYATANLLHLLLCSKVVSTPVPSQKLCEGQTGLQLVLMLFGLIHPASVFAETSVQLQALEKISHEHPAACLRHGGLLASLSYLDFFQTGVQRVAVATAANMCRSVTSENTDAVASAIPILTNLLQYQVNATIARITSFCRMWQYTFTLVCILRFFASCTSAFIVWGEWCSPVWHLLIQVL